MVTRGPGTGAVRPSSARAAGWSFVGPKQPGKTGTTIDRWEALNSELLSRRAIERSQARPADPQTGRFRGTHRALAPDSLPTTAHCRAQSVTAGHAKAVAQTVCKTPGHDRDCIAAGQSVFAGQQPFPDLSGGRGIRTHEPGVNPVNGFQDRPLYRL